MALRRRRAQRPQQQTECDDVRDHQQGYEDDRDCVGGAQMPCNRGKAKQGSVVIIDYQVGHARDIEGDDEEPKKADVY